VSASSEDLIQSILSSALICFSEAHYHRVSLADVAAEAKLEESQITEHFPTKADLVLALVKSVEQDLDDVLEEHAPALERWADIADTLLIYARFTVEEAFFARYFRLIMFNLDDCEELKPVHAYISEQEWAFMEDLATAFKEERSQTAFETYLSDSELARICFSTWEGLLTNAFYHQDLETILPRIKSTLDMFYQGLIAGAAKTSAE
jgi:AcrR family transcriptional regulator